MLAICPFCLSWLDKLTDIITVSLKRYVIGQLPTLPKILFGSFGFSSSSNEKILATKSNHCSSIFSRINHQLQTSGLARLTVVVIAVNVAMAALQQSSETPVQCWRRKWRQKCFDSELPWIEHQLSYHPRGLDRHLHLRSKETHRGNSKFTWLCRDRIDPKAECVLENLRWGKQLRELVYSPDSGILTSKIIFIAV